MDGTRTAVWTTVALVVVVSIVAGPLVSSVDVVTPPRGSESVFCDPHGSADVAVEHVPTERFELKRQAFGAKEYALTVDNTLIEVTNVTGCSVLTYLVEIPSLGYTSTTHSYVSEETRGVQYLSVVGGSFAPDRVTNDSYTARLTVELRNDRTHVVVRENVTVPVEG